MRKESVLLLLGLFIAAVPFLGVSSSLLTTFVVVSGIGVVLLAFSLRAKSRTRSSSKDEHATFAETRARRTIVKGHHTEQARNTAKNVEEKEKRFEKEISRKV